jgi:hypothetical protein
MNETQALVSKTDILIAKLLRVVRYMGAGIIFLSGFLLSPITWWNDLVVNVPIAWIMASIFPEPIFKFMFVVSYWITNIVGLVMMHYSRSFVKDKGKAVFTRKDFKKFLIITSIYTLVFCVLMGVGVIKPMDFSAIGNIAPK